MHYKATLSPGLRRACKPKSVTAAVVGLSPACDPLLLQEDIIERASCAPQCCRCVSKLVMCRNRAPPCQMSGVFDVIRPVANSLMNLLLLCLRTGVRPARRSSSTATCRSGARASRTWRAASRASATGAPRSTSSARYAHTPLPPARLHGLIIRVLAPSSSVWVDDDRVDERIA